jgi:diguanylate cyclase (GGDEF)-like protein
MSEKSIKKYFDDVEPYSEEHLNDMDKLKNLLEKMKGEGNDSVEPALVSFGDTLQRLDSYIKTNRVALTEKEKQEIDRISRSRLSPAVIRRLLEDLFHSIKKRHERQSRERQREDKALQEISELRSSGVVLDWIRLTLFSLEHGTLTLFRHQLKESALKLVRDIFPGWHKEVVRHLRPILDNEYYLFSTLEYNSLEIILRLQDPLQNLSNVRGGVSYHPHLLSEEMNALARVYCKINYNRDMIADTISRAFRGRNTEHGFMSMVHNLLDQRIVDNRVTPIDTLRNAGKSVMGVLASYYTTKEGFPVYSGNQILYILGEDGAIDEREKHLTGAARDRDRERRERQEGEEEKLIGRIEELERALQRLLPRGPYLEDRLFRQEAKGNYSNWKKEMKKKPFFRLLRLVEGYIRYFVELFSDQDSLVLIFDQKEFDDYLKQHSDITGVASRYTMDKFDLLGNLYRDLIRIELPEDMTVDSFIKALMTMQVSDGSLEPSLRRAREILRKVASESYELGIRTLSLISDYEERREIVDENLYRNYDFFTHAALRDSRAVSLSKIIDSDTVTLQNLLESLSSLGFHIAELLNHEGVEGMKKEKEELSGRLAEIRGPGLIEDDFEGITGGFTEEEAEELKKDRQLQEGLNRLYKDSLTGLWKYEYFEDQLMPRLYDSEKKYAGPPGRFLFIVEADGFKRANKVYGHDVGDEILQRTSHLLSRELAQRGNRRDQAFRIRGGQIMGFINDTTLSEAADLLGKFNANLQQEVILHEGKDIGQVSASIGLYEEREGALHTWTLSVTRRLLGYAQKQGGGVLALIRDPSHIVAERDFDRFGDIDETLIALSGG